MKSSNIQADSIFVEAIQKITACTGEKEVYFVTTNYLHQLLPRFSLVSFTLFDDADENYEIVELSGIPAAIEKTLSLLNLRLKGLKGKLSPTRLEKLIKGVITVEGNNLNELSGGETPTKLQRAFDKVLPRFKVYTIPVFRENNRLGVISVTTNQNIEPYKDSIILFSDVVANTLWRIQSHQETIDNEEKLKIATKIANLAYWEWDIATDKVTWSDQMFELFEIPHSKYAPPFPTHSQFFHEEDFKKLVKAVQLCVSTGEGYRFPMRSSEKLGNKVFRVVGNPLLNQGKVAKLFGTVQDVTKEIQQELKLEEQNKTLSALNADFDFILKTLSHDLRSPINTAKGLLQLLDSPSSKEETDFVLNSMNRSVRRMEDITNELLMLMQGFDAKAKVPSTNIILYDLVSEILEDLVYTEGYTEIEWRINKELHCNLPVPASIPRVILRNLLSNALKYYDPSKKSFIEVACEHTEKWHIISVTDNGIGMSEREQQHIFNSFKQIDRSKDGFGLGLYIANQAVQKAHGKLELTSKKGQGSTFRVYFPK